MKKYFKIGEISQLFGVGTDSIRYYEEIGAIRPARGENGYRLYRVQDIWRLNVIRDLRNLGFSMERIVEYLNNRSIQTTQTMLEEELLAIEKNLQRLGRLRDNVASRLTTLHQAEERAEGEIRLEQLPARRCYEIPEGYTNDEEMDVLIQRLLRIDQSRLYLIGNNRSGSRLGMDAVLAGRYRAYRSVFVMDEKGDVEIPAGGYLSVSYRGQNNRNAIYIPQMLAYAKEHGLQPVGDILELLLIDIHEAADPDEYITELQLRVARPAG